jgi:hypothetical protein
MMSNTTTLGAVRRWLCGGHGHWLLCDGLRRAGTRRSSSPSSNTREIVNARYAGGGRLTIDSSLSLEHTVGMATGKIKAVAVGEKKMVLALLARGAVRRA